VRLSYGALLDRAERLACGLVGLGLRPGQVVAVVSRSALPAALLAHALPRLGCALAPFNPRTPGPWLGALLGQTRAALVVADSGVPVPPGLPRLDVRQVESPAEPPAGLAAPAGPLDARDVHLVCATSGTGGMPRPVMLSGANLAASAAASRSRLPLGPGDRWLACLPLYHVGGLSVVYRCAEAGAEVVLHDGFDPSRVAATLARCGITHLSIVPAMLARLLEATGERAPPSSLRHVLVGGGPLSRPLAEHARRAGWPLRPSYGLTEAASQVATLEDWPDDWQPGLVGAPLPGFEVRITGTQGAGPIEVRGPAVTVGYANPDGIPGVGLFEGWLRTGDRGRVDAGGRLTVLGRTDDVLVTGGENVHPSEVEALLAACPGVEDAAVTGEPDPVWGERLVALFVGGAAEAEVEAWCRTHLSGAWRPRGFRRVSEIPRGVLGKIDRKALRARVRDGHLKE
jgi:O-succinylbenzoic acid--CoA ligase